MGQTIVSGADAQIQWCCDEITSAGLQTVTGVNANGTIATAGTYFARATLEVRGQTNALTNPMLWLETDDNTTNMNQPDTAGVPLEWSSTVLSGVGGFSWDPGDPTKITALYAGTARFTFSLQAENTVLVSSADEVAAWVRKNDVFVLPALATLRFDNFAGVDHGNVTVFDDDVAVGDYYELAACANAPIVNAVTTGAGVLGPNTFITAERLTIPGISAHLDLYDPTDTFVETIDTQSVSGFDYAFSLGGVFSAQSGFKVKAFVGHSDESQTFTVTDESHMDVIKVGGYLPWETC